MKIKGDNRFIEHSNPLNEEQSKAAETVTDAALMRVKERFNRGPRSSR